jgi:hypothetical protein
MRRMPTRPRGSRRVASSGSCWLRRSMARERWPVAATTSIFAVRESRRPAMSRETRSPPRFAMGTLATEGAATANRSPGMRREDSRPWRTCWDFALQPRSMITNSPAMGRRASNVRFRQPCPRQHWFGWNPMTR